MLKLITLTILACYVVQISATNMLGPGIWSLISISKCPMEINNEVIKVDIDKHKLNRTHDGISADVTTTDTIDSKYAALIEICKYVDGGCKPYQILSDNDVVAMLNKYAAENVLNALTLAKIDPPEFPVEKGEYHVDDYVMDYCNLPREAVYGEFEALSFLVHNNEKVGCVKCVLEFNKFEDDENFCDE